MQWFAPKLFLTCTYEYLLIDFLFAVGLFEQENNPKALVLKTCTKSTSITLKPLPKLVFISYHLFCLCKLTNAINDNWYHWYTLWHTFYIYINEDNFISKRNPVLPRNPKQPLSSLNLIRRIKSSQTMCVRGINLLLGKLLKYYYLFKF